MDDFVFLAGKTCKAGASVGSSSNFWECIKSLNLESQIADFYVSNFSVVIHPQAEAWSDEIHRLLWDGAAPTLTVSVGCFAAIKILSGVFKGL